MPENEKEAAYWSHKSLDGCAAVPNPNRILFAVLFCEQNLRSVQVKQPFYTEICDAIIDLGLSAAGRVHSAFMTDVHRHIN